MKTFTDDLKPCTSCGRLVKGIKNFIGKPEYHCYEPLPFGCWPVSLVELDKLWEQKVKEIIGRI
jgi:hypothetical protein